ncbi:hypothetical protein CHARACLAT_025730 [Characodon lateralis]|uniref:Uncharacterized protein n=1 Tax=Characodon lateralis TaxID=208331 RepID=A0ABU7DUB7_9TELE|nr:hypothetical protein [Characodon lateralis]
MSCSPKEKRPWKICILKKMEAKSKRFHVSPRFSKTGEGEKGMLGGISRFYSEAMEGELVAPEPVFSYTCEVSSSIMGRQTEPSEERRREASQSRAGLTSIGLQTKRTRLLNQTSPRRAQEHSRKI